jgi:hypothetical protein
MHKIEYRVRPVTRWIVTRWESQSNDNGNASGGCAPCGEFANEDAAYKAGEALAFKEREDLGWPPGDERMQFPDRYKAEG